MEKPYRAAGLLVAASVGYGVLLLALAYAGMIVPGMAFTREIGILSLSRGLEWILVGPTLLLLYRRIQSLKLTVAPRVMAYLLAAIALHSLTEIGHTMFAQEVVGYGDHLSFYVFYKASWKNSVLIHAIVYLGVVGVVYGYDQYIESLRLKEAYQAREVREARLESELARAQLHALRMQIHPHFLFNALSAAAALTKKDPLRARRVLVDLGELLRLALDTTDDEIPLRDELTVLDRYFRIEKARMGERLRVTVHAAPNVLDALVPPLILQPLAENAVKHGLAPLEEGGAVEVRAVRSGSDLVISVADTGRGLAAPQSGVGGNGIGLENVRRRLDRLYGASASLTLDSRAGDGLLAVLRLPYRPSHTVLTRPAEDCPSAILAR